MASALEITGDAVSIIIVVVDEHVARVARVSDFRSTHVGERCESIPTIDTPIAHQNRPVLVVWEGRRGGGLMLPTRPSISCQEDSFDLFCS